MWVMCCVMTCETWHSYVVSWHVSDVLCHDMWVMCCVMTCEWCVASWHVSDVLCHDIWDMPILLCATSLMSHTCVWHATYLYDIHVTHMCMICNISVWHDLCHTHVYDMQHICMTFMSHTCVWYATYLYDMTHVTHMWMTCNISVWHDSCHTHVYDMQHICMTWLVWITLRIVESSLAFIHGDVSNRLYSFDWVYSLGVCDVVWGRDMGTWHNRMSTADCREWVQANKWVENQQMSRGDCR